MKRSDELLKLSREHHSALVLSKRAQRLSLGAAVEALGFMQELPTTFARELEPHFQVEEIAMLSALRDAQAQDAGLAVSALVERTLLEHARLRELSTLLGQGGFQYLAEFAELLSSHVRFEERELFNVAERLLSPDSLARIAAAAEQQGPGMIPPSNLPS